MVSNLRRSSIAPRNDPHDWNSWDHYRTIHERRLSDHPFVVRFQDTLVSTVSEDGSAVSLEGLVSCRNGVVLEVTKEFDTRYVGNSLRVRCRTYRYIGLAPGQGLLLKYHNRHADPDEYHHRVYDPENGWEIFHEVLERYQFPTFPEVLDELEILAQNL